MNIGFDLDEIFVSHPPLVPASIIAFLYRGTQNKVLHYRMPGKLEKKLRIFTHMPIFRPIIKQNIDFALHLSQKKGYKLHLISSRFSFLKEITDSFVKKNQLLNIFSSINFNFKDEQPHEFKSRIMDKLNLDKYVDDDLYLLKYLAQHNKTTTFYWFNSKTEGKIGENLIAITNLEQIL